MEGTRFTRGSKRLSVALLAIGALATGLVSPASAPAATTITIAPDTPSVGNAFPFGRGDLWTPFMGFVYKNVPAFALKPNDVLAFDLRNPNEVAIQLKLEMVATTVNGGDIPAGAFTTIASNTQTPANPVGNAVSGDFELRFRSESAFAFAGGGLLIRASSPGGAFAADATPQSVLNGGAATDTSGFFAGRYYADIDGLPPYGASDIIDIASFRVEIADLPQKAGTQPRPKCAKKKGKKRAAASAKKKSCKKGKRKK